VGKILIFITVLISLGLASGVLAANFAATRVYFNIPADTTFSIAMPDNYTFFNTTITGTTLAAATETDWITFNFSTAPQAILQEPSAAGNFSRNQTAPNTPIFLLDNLGNTNISITVYSNNSSAEPTNIFWWWNITTNATGCGTVPTGLQRMNTSATPIITSFFQGPGSGGGNCFANLSMFANTTVGVQGGTFMSWLITNSSPT